MDILKKAREIPDAVHLEIGEPDLEPPPEVIERLNLAIAQKRFNYTPALGLWELRERIAKHYWDYYKVDVNPSRIVITTGTSSAFLVAYSMLMEVGDSVALADPSYPCYKNFAYLLGIKPVFVDVDESTNYQITPEHLWDKDIKAVHISSPSNPTGTLYTEENLRALCEYCREKDIYLISDEIYHGLVYERKERTVLEFWDRAIVINGFSKFFCMPGFRIGWMILPEELIRPAEIVMQNTYICAPTLSQYSALGAFDYEYLSKVRETFRKRRDVLYEGIKDIFLVFAKPEGAFYIWADIGRYSEDSYEFCMKVLKDAKVAITPGVDFGKNKTNRFVRFAYTRKEEELRLAVERLKEYLT
ncbi:pyridoxal phosphate-dependent aminotransferase [Thermocrinis sp.]